MRLASFIQAALVVPALAAGLAALVLVIITAASSARSSRDGFLSAGPAQDLADRFADPVVPEVPYRTSSGARVGSRAKS